jgi:hypothetical protein
MRAIAVGIAGVVRALRGGLIGIVRAPRRVRRRRSCTQRDHDEHGWQQTGCASRHHASIDGPPVNLDASPLGSAKPCPCRAWCADRDAEHLGAVLGAESVDDQIAGMDLARIHVRNGASRRGRTPGGTGFPAGADQRAANRRYTHARRGRAPRVGRGSPMGSAGLEPATSCL